MNVRVVLVGIVGAALCFVFVSASAAKNGSPALVAPTVTVADSPGNGLIPFPTTTFTAADLAKLPQQSDTVAIGGVSTTESGPLLSAVLTSAGFKPVSTCKNDDLHYWVESSSLNGSSAEITDGELDPMFGNDPAILSISENGSALAVPRLVVPHDATDARDIQDVFNVTIGRAAPQVTAIGSQLGCTPVGFVPPLSPPIIPPGTPSDGSVRVVGAIANPTTVSLAALQALPQVSQTDTFKQGPSTKVETEVGPTLSSVLNPLGPQFSGPNDDLNFYVQATSSEDGSADLVSWAEIAANRNANPDLLSLVDGGQGVLVRDTGPRLTSPGDVAGGRYDFGVQLLNVFQAPSVAPVAGSGQNLSGANLNGAQLPGYYLVGASLQDANLNKSDLSGAFLDVANLAGANLNKADLSEALLNGADLGGANLNGADLSGANLSGADLEGANLNGSNLTGTVFSSTICPDGSNSNDDGGTCANNE